MAFPFGVPRALPRLRLATSVEKEADGASFELDVYRLAKHFSQEAFETTIDAREFELQDEDGNEDLGDNFSPVTYNLLFSCDPRTFTKTSDNKWWDSDTQQLYIIGTADVICDYDTKTRLALRPEPFGFVVILCPAVLTQRNGEPKMWADLAGQELSNTRPTIQPADPNHVTEIESLDLGIWAGMNIDQLRDRVLSVYMGRVVLFLTGQKHYKQVIGKHQSHLKCLRGVLCAETYRSSTYGKLPQLQRLQNPSIEQRCSEPRLSFHLLHRYVS